MIRQIYKVALCLWLILKCLPNVHAQTMEQLFKKGNELYRQEQFEAAIQQYTTIIGSQSADSSTKGDAYYNMGNAFAKWGKWDMAVSAYRSALAHRPGFSLAQYNLIYARNKLPPPDKKQHQSGDSNKQKGSPPPPQTNKDKQQSEQILKALREQEQRIKQQSVRPNDKGAIYNQKNW